MPLLDRTTHMSHLLLSGYLWDSMHFEEIAEVMTAHGLDTTHNQAMDAYENCTKLGYPRGGTPKAWPPVYDEGTSDFPHIEIEEAFYCQDLNCGNQISTEDHARDGLCGDCLEESNEAVPREPRTSDLTRGAYADNCKCGHPNPRWTCRGCSGPLCNGCRPRYPITGALWWYHWECMSPEQKRRFNRA